MFNIPISITSRNEIMDIFEIFTKFPHDSVMIKNGDNTIDAHSIMGFFSLDISKPVEVLMHKEPDNDMTKALSKYIAVF